MVNHQLFFDIAPQCPDNEYYSNCINGDCSVQNCKDVGLPISCPRIDPKYCKAGCLCNEGYARNEKGVCIPKNECREYIFCQQNASFIPQRA